VATAAPASADHRGKAVPRDLQSIQASMQKNDLTAAQAALNGLLAAQPDNADALRIRQELQMREQARDASLRVARGCAQQGSWTCVWHNAGDALTTDTGSAEAKSLIVRSIRESGWSGAPTGPGPDQPHGP
jgi:predicted Zn-dependent protease